VSIETIGFGGIQKFELRNVRVAVGMCLRNTSTSTSITIRNEYSNVFLYILSDYFRFSMLSDNPVCEAWCSCLWIAFTNKYEKCSREMA